jgi:hypothetical protein
MVLYLFNHQSNVDVDSRFTVYGIRDLGSELSPITILVMMESILQRIVENGKRGKATWLILMNFTGRDVPPILVRINNNMFVFLSLQRIVRVSACFGKKKLIKK